MEDKIVETVRQKLLDRSRVGIDKYGVTLDRDDMSFSDWLTYAQEEALDFALYLEKLIQQQKGQPCQKTGIKS